MLKPKVKASEFKKFGFKRCKGIAVDKRTGKAYSCDFIACCNCLLYDRHDCDKKRREWAESEYIEKPVISKRDRAFLEYLNGKIKYITRDGAGELYAYSAKPCKERGAWMPQTGEFFNLDFYFSADFPMVKWSDEEPWLIEDLKKLEVVDSYE